MALPTDEKILAWQKDRELERAAQARSDLRAMLSTPAGRRFVWRMIDANAGAFSLSYAGHAEEMIFKEGRRAVGLELMEEAQRECPSEYLLMVQEALKARELEQLKLNADLAGVKRLDE